MKISYISRLCESGYTILELVVTLTLASVLMGIAVVNLREMANPAQSSAAAVSSFFKEARARAISTTSAYTVTPENTRRLVAGSSVACGEATTPDDALILNLSDEVDLTTLGWSVCFSARGFPDRDTTINLVDNYDETNSIDIFLGGAIRFQ